MATSTVKYLGELRTECTHVKSGAKIITDAPTDNNGKGESFSPTDMVASAYASCMLTIIGIYCSKRNLPFTQGSASVEKIMTDSPRRIGELKIILDLSENNWTTETKEAIVRVAEACPVAKSVSKEMTIKIDFILNK